MKTVRRILAATDFSPTAEVAVALAADLARRYDATLELVFVFERNLHLAPDDFRLISPEHASSLLAGYRAQLNTVKDAALAAGAPRVDVTVLEGEARTEVVRYAAERSADLIVMGTHGRKALARLWIGSVATNVIRTAHCPVLTVRGAGPLPGCDAQA